MTLTFFELQKRNSQGKFTPDGNIAYIKHVQSLEIDKLKLKEKPRINQILFQVSTGSPKTETMILCTHYGLLVYEWTLAPDQLRKKDKNEEEEESKDAEANQAEDNCLKISYKLSVLPDQPVLDCISFQQEKNESQLLVCCASGFYVILKKLSTIVYQEVWRFKGFTSPPKGFLMCDEQRVLVIEASSLALIDLRKKDITPFTPRSENPHKNAMKSQSMQSRALLPELLQATTGNKCCTILNQPNLHLQK